MAADFFSFYQLLGWVGVLLYLVSYQILSPRRTVLLWGIANAIYAVHWYGLGAYPAMVIAIGASIRDLSSAFAPQNILRIVMLLFLIYAWTGTIIMADQPYEYLAVIGTTFLTAASYSRESSRFYRQRGFSFGHQFCWLIYSLIAGSYPGVFQNSTVMLSNLIGIIRYRFRQRSSGGSGAESDAK